jgi:uncharacterized radical SAM superfamily Fe-S cluster-containing enzyme
MTFVIGAEMLEKNVMNVYFRTSFQITKVHVCVVHYNMEEEKWNPIGAWRMLNILSSMVDMTEQQLLAQLKKKKEITFNNQVNVV